MANIFIEICMNKISETFKFHVKFDRMFYTYFRTNKLNKLAHLSG